jgi:hypothetical protein
MTDSRGNSPPLNWRRFSERALGIVIIVGSSGVCPGAVASGNPHRPEVVALGVRPRQPARRRQPHDREKVLEATKLIKTGQVYQLGHVYEQGMPLAGNRSFKLTIPGSPTAPI